MVKIRSRKEFENWLNQDLAILMSDNLIQMFAARIALRIIPMALNDKIIEANLDFIQPILRQVMISWAASQIPSDHSKIAIFDMNGAAYAANDAISAAVRATFVAHPSYNSSPDRDTVNTADSATHAYSAFAPAIWKSIEQDAISREEYNSLSIGSGLIHQPLWKKPLPVQVFHEWAKATSKLIALNKNYAIWIDWYERRLRGEEAAFDIPHDKDREEDKAILIKLADATDEDFWSKGAEHVNAQLGEWLREARERAQERYDAENAIVNESDEDIFIPNQNTNAITFQRGETGKIAVNQTASSDEILKDADSVERQQLTLEDALEIRRKCETSNAGARLTQLLENYINSIGQSLEEIKPSMTVQRGEKLRQELAAYDNTDNMLAPISDEILLDLKSWQSAHNMMVGLQPKLNALDTSMAGPDRQPAEFTPDDLRKLANDAENLELIEVSTKEILDETVDQADGVKDYKDRKFVWSAETAKNLVIEAINIAKDKPKTAITSVTTIAISVSNPSVSIPLAIIAAGFLIKNRNWVESKMGNAQTWKSLFSHLCDTYDGIINFDKNSP